MTTHAMKKGALPTFDEAPPRALARQPSEEEGCEGAEAAAVTSLLQECGFGVWRLDFVSDCYEVSPGCKASLGVGPDELRTFTDFKALVHPDDRASLDDALRRVIDGADEYVVEYRIRGRTGHTRWVLARGRVCGSGRERRMIAGVAVDITEQKRMYAERERLMEELAAERARLRAVVDHLPAAVIVADAAGRVVLTNQAWTTVYPAPHPAVPLDTAELFRHYSARHADGTPVDPHERPLSRALRGETVAEEDFRFRRQDGSESWICISSAPVLDEDGKLNGAVSIATDVNDRKRAAAERESLLRSLQHSEDRYRLAALATDDEIYEWDIPNDRVNVHRKSSHMHEPILRFDDWSKLIHPEDRERVVAGLVAAVDRGDQHWLDEYRFAKGDGTWLTISDRGHIEHDASGRPTRMVGAMQDVTARRRQEELERQLIGIVSHDLKNPLNTILLAAGMVAGSEDVGERVARNTVRIQGAAQRATRMIGDLLDFTRARLGGGIPIERHHIALGPIVGDLIEDIRVANAGHPIVLETTGDLTGDFDGDRLAQIVTNLVENAVKYSAHGTPVRVVIDGTEEDVVQLRVHNEGPPIPRALLPRIFEPLTRGDSAFDARGRNVGLGLYIVQQLVVAHGGSIEVRSSERDGTELAVRLPRSVAPPSSDV